VNDAEHEIRGNNNMKKGDYFGVLQYSNETNRSWLYSECRSIKGNILEGFVINGHWKYTMNLATGDATIHTPWGPTYHKGWKLGYTDKLPKHLDKNDYNAVIQYMDSVVPFSDPSLVQQIINHVVCWIRRREQFVIDQSLRFGAACSAFKHSWNGTVSEEDREEEEYNDEIPF
jgi:hypothetical protein